MVNPVLAAALVAWLRVCALQYGVDPEFAQAVMIVESRAPGDELGIRVGVIGRGREKTVGPMGIALCFKSKYTILDPYENVRVGVLALRGSEERVLRRYNREYNSRYGAQVRKVKRLLKGIYRVLPPGAVFS